MSAEKDFNGVRYEGYDPRAERCKFSVPSGWGTATPYPNARLISAAPDLLEAARNALTQLADEQAGYPEKERHESPRSTLDRLRDALTIAGLEV